MRHRLHVHTPRSSTVRTHTIQHVYTTQYTQSKTRRAKTHTTCVAKEQRLKDQNTCHAHAHCTSMYETRRVIQHTSHLFAQTHSVRSIITSHVHALCGTKERTRAQTRTRAPHMHRIMHSGVVSTKGSGRRIIHMQSKHTPPLYTHTPCAKHYNKTYTKNHTPAIPHTRSVCRETYNTKLSTSRLTHTPRARTVV